jgi:hypothetical protein
MSRKDDFVLCRAGLLKLRLKAQRAGSWVRTLDRIDRVMINLAIIVADKVRSPKLAKAIFCIVNKLERVSENRGFSRIVREAGFALARRLSFLAQKWGNKHARNWASDISFARFLAIMDLNESRVIRR